MSLFTKINVTDPSKANFTFRGQSVQIDSIAFEVLKRKGYIISDITNPTDLMFNISDFLKHINKSKPSKAIKAPKEITFETMTQQPKKTAKAKRLKNDEMVFDEFVARFREQFKLHTIESRRFISTALKSHIFEITPCDFQSLMQLDQNEKIRTSNSDDAAIIFGKLKFSSEWLERMSQHDPRMYQGLKQYLDQDSKVVFKVYYPRGVNSAHLSTEVEVYDRVINDLLDNHCTPHIFVPILYYRCQNFSPPNAPEYAELKKALEGIAVASSSGTNDNTSTTLRHLDVLVLERGADTSGGWMNSELANFCTALLEKAPAEEVKTIMTNIMFQIVWTLECFRQYGLMHNDLHHRNVQIITLESPIDLVYKMYDNVSKKHKVFRMKTRYIAKIFDFDRSTVQLSYESTEFDRKRRTPLALEANLKESKDVSFLKPPNEIVLSDVVHEIYSDIAIQNFSKQQLPTKYANIAKDIDAQIKSLFSTLKGNDPLVKVTENNVEAAVKKEADQLSNTSQIQQIRSLMPQLDSYWFAAFLALLKNPIGSNREARTLLVLTFHLLNTAKHDMKSMTYLFIVPLMRKAYQYSSDLSVETSMDYLFNQVRATKNFPESVLKYIENKYPEDYRVYVSQHWTRDIEIAPNLFPSEVTFLNKSLDDINLAELQKTIAKSWSAGKFDDYIFGIRNWILQNKKGYLQILKMLHDLLANDLKTDEDFVGDFIESFELIVGTMMNQSITDESRKKIFVEAKNLLRSLEYEEEVVNEFEEEVGEKMYVPWKLLTRSPIPKFNGSFQDTAAAALTWKNGLYNTSVDDYKLSGQFNAYNPFFDLYSICWWLFQSLSGPKAEPLKTIITKIFFNKSDLIKDKSWRYMGLSCDYKQNDAIKPLDSLLDDVFQHYVLDASQTKQTRTKDAAAMIKKLKDFHNELREKLKTISDSNGKPISNPDAYLEENFSDYAKWIDKDGKIGGGFKFALDKYVSNGPSAEKLFELKQVAKFRMLPVIFRSCLAPKIFDSTTQMMTPRMVLESDIFDSLASTEVANSPHLYKLPDVVYRYAGEEVEDDDSESSGSNDSQETTTTYATEATAASNE